MLENQHADTRNECADPELNARHLHAIHQRRKMVNNQNVDRKQQRARQPDQIALGKTEATARHAQEIQADQRQRDTTPVLESALAAKQQAEQRHDQNVARGQESGLADRNIQQRNLLDGAGNAQDQAAACTADQ